MSVLRDWVGASVACDSRESSDWFLGVSTMLPVPDPGTSTGKDAEEAEAVAEAEAEEMDGMRGAWLNHFFVTSIAEVLAVEELEAEAAPPNKAGAVSTRLIPKPDNSSFALSRSLVESECAPRVV